MTSVTGVTGVTNWRLPQAPSALGSALVVGAVEAAAAAAAAARAGGGLRPSAKRRKPAAAPAVFWGGAAAVAATPAAAPATAATPAAAASSGLGRGVGTGTPLATGELGLGATGSNLSALPQGGPAEAEYEVKGPTAGSVDMAACSQGAPPTRHLPTAGDFDMAACSQGALSAKHMQMHLTGGVGDGCARPAGEGPGPGGGDGQAPLEGVGIVPGLLAFAETAETVSADRGVDTEEGGKDRGPIPSTLPAEAIPPLIGGAEPGEKEREDRERDDKGDGPKLLADLVEAVLGAVLLDSGGDLQAVRTALQGLQAAADKAVLAAADAAWAGAGRK